MNNVSIRGYLRDKEYSHNIGDIEYEKANLVCPGVNGQEDDIISLRYKKLCCKYNEGDFIEIKGNLRSYSHKENNKNSVEIYLFTYFDLPDIPSHNIVNIDGRICKIEKLGTSKNGIPYLHFILANNIFIKDRNKINNYIPCTVYGELAEEMSNLNVNDFINLAGEFHSHTYTKNINGELEYRIAHEVVVYEYRSKVG